MIFNQNLYKISNFLKKLSSFKSTFKHRFSSSTRNCEMREIKYPRTLNQIEIIFYDKIASLWT